LDVFVAVQMQNDEGGGQQKNKKDRDVIG